MTKHFLTPLIERFWRHVGKRGPDECWRWTGATASYGYGVLGIGRVNDGLVRAHRLSWEIHNGPIPDGMKVLHHCDNPPCTNPNHLFLGTQRDNMRDRAAKGRGSPPPSDGERNPSARLSADDVTAIRAHGGTHREIAEKFGVCKSTITRIKSGHGWNSVIQKHTGDSNDSSHSSPK